MTGGFSVIGSTSTDVVEIFGRVSTAGVKVAPASGSGKWTVSRSSAGVYLLKFSEQYAEFLGLTLDVEGAAASTSIVYTWSAVTRTATVSAFALTVATDQYWAFNAAFSENRAP